MKSFCFALVVMEHVDEDKDNLGIFSISMMANLSYSSLL